MNRIIHNVSASNRSQIKNYVRKIKYCTELSLTISIKKKRNAIDARKLLKFHVKTAI